MPPEMLASRSYGKCVDWYLLGVILYEMLIGIPPYFDTDPDKYRGQILRAKLEFPLELSDDCKDLLFKLLSR
jgi:serum/glucocorticoid-regulated kinase 2